jgi:hypothetical protein
VDSLNLTSGPIAPSWASAVVSISGTNPVTYTLLADCVTDQTIVFLRARFPTASVFDVTAIRSRL